MSNRKIGNFDFCVKPSIAAAILSTKLNFNATFARIVFGHTELCKVDNGFGLEIVLAVVKKCPFIKVP